MNFLKPSVACVLLALTALESVPLRAQPTPAASAARLPLWQVQGEHCAVHLLGSVHVLKREHYPLPAAMESAFTNARVVAFETDVAALTDPAVARQLMNKSRLPEGETLRDQLSPELHARFTNHLREAGLPAAIFEPLQPMMAALTLVMLEMRQLELDPELGLDKHFHARARADRKRIVPLETVDFQIRLLTEMSREEGELILHTTLRDLDKMKHELGDLLQAWQSGDAPKLDTILNEAKQEAPLIFKRWLTDRNRAWLPKIEALARGKENAIVIVGAGHLVGRKGVVELLRQRGWTVTQASQQAGRTPESPDASNRNR